MITDYGKPEFKIEDGALIKYTPIAIDGRNDGICKVETVITKEAFLECYNKWVLFKED